MTGLGGEIAGAVSEAANLAPESTAAVTGGAPPPQRAPEAVPPAHVKGLNPSSYLRAHRGAPVVHMPTKDGSSALPATYTTFTEEDDRLDLKQQLAAKPETLGQVFVEDKDVKALQKKREAYDMFKFDQWFAQQYDFSKPEEIVRARKLNPEFFERRKQYMLTNLEIAKKMAMLSVEGPQSVEDMYFLYGVNSGEIQSPPAEFWNPRANQQVTSESARNEFVRGLFRPWQSSAMTQIPSSLGWYSLQSQPTRYTQPTYETALVGRKAQTLLGLLR